LVAVTSDNVANRSGDGENVGIGAGQIVEAQGIGTESMVGSWDTVISQVARKTGTLPILSCVVCENIEFSSYISWSEIVLTNRQNFFGGGDSSPQGFHANCFEIFLSGADRTERSRVFAGKKSIIETGNLGSTDVSAKVGSFRTFVRVGNGRSGSELVVREPDISQVGSLLTTFTRT